MEEATSAQAVEQTEQAPDPWTPEDREEYERWLDEIAPSDPPEWFLWDGSANK